MADDDVLTVVQALVQGEPERAVTVGEVAEAIATSDLDEVSTHLEQLREGGRLFRAVGADSDHPPAVVTYTPYD